MKKPKLTTLPRYKQNLAITDTNVVSYGTNVAVIDHVNQTVTHLPWNVNGMTTSPTTTKHVNYVASYLSEFHGCLYTVGGK
jgi:hypothetical protein